MRKTVLLFCLSALTACYDPPFRGPADASEPQPENPEPSPSPSSAPSPLYPADAGENGALALVNQFDTPPRSVWVVSQTEVWVVGDGNLVRRFDGSSWHDEATAQTSQVDWRFVRGRGAAKYALGVASEQTVLLDLVNRNVRELRLSQPVLLSLSGPELYIGGREGTQGVLLHSTNRGVSWEKETLPDCAPVIGGGALEEAGRENDQPLWLRPVLVLEDGRLLHYLDGGEWDGAGWYLTEQATPHSPSGAFSAWLIPDNVWPNPVSYRLWGLIAAGELRAWNGGGSTIAVPVPDQLPFTPLAVWGETAERFWVAGTAGRISRFEGLAATSYQLPTDDDVLAVHGAYHRAWFVTQGGRIFRWAE